MILIFRKQTAVLAALLVGLSIGLLRAFPLSGWDPVPTLSPIPAEVRVVIDPGHGGEDGGAVSPDGLPESGLNLEISRMLRDLLVLSGQAVTMTRSDDSSLDNGEATVRGRKAADLRARVELVNRSKPAVLLSIHQNSLPASPVTHGAQAFWNLQPGAEKLAQAIQDDLNRCANPGNEKHTRQIPTAVYLMKHCMAPGVLVECGFLSNAEETRRLGDPIYQRKLAAAIGAGYLRWAAGEEPI